MNKNMKFLSLLLSAVCMSSPVMAQSAPQNKTQEAAAQKQEVQSTLQDVDMTSFEVNDYFDAEDLAPPLEGEEDEDYELRMLDPEKDKASRFVVVDKTAKADSASARLEAAKRAMDLGRFEASIRIYEGLLEETPKDPAVLIGYAAALQKSGRDDEAIATYEDLLSLEPDNIDAHINMLGLIGNRYPAVALQRLKALDGKSNEFNPALVGQIAFVQAKLGRYKPALKSYALIASREPENALHFLNMAIVADRAGLQKEAVEYYEQALEIDTIYSGGRSLSRDQIFDRLAQLR